MEEDILNFSPTVMFRGTPCIYTRFVYFDPAEVAYGGGEPSLRNIGGTSPSLEPWWGDTPLEKKLERYLFLRMVWHFCFLKFHLKKLLDKNVEVSSKKNISTEATQIFQSQGVWNKFAWKTSITYLRLFWWISQKKNHKI